MSHLVPGSSSSSTSTSVTTTAVTPTPPDALARVREELDRIPDADVLTPRVDVAAAALTAIGAMPEIEAHRPVIAAVFGERGGASLDVLVPRARALILAHAEHAAVAERDLEPMARQVMDVRVRLFTAAEALMARGVIDGKSMDGLVGGQGYQARVVDTLSLVSWFRSHAASIAPFSKVGAAELDEAQALADAFGTAFSERDQARAGSTPSAKTRARAFTLFFQTYEHVRQMLTYLRWHQGDVERIAPSLYAGRGRRRDDGDLDIAPPPAVPVAPGMPGSDPFIRT